MSPGPRTCAWPRLHPPRVGFRSAFWLFLVLALPWGFAGHATERIPITILVDEEEATVDAVWQRRLADRVREASAIIERHADVRFVPQKFARWSSDPRIQDFTQSLREFESEIEAPPKGIAIGFSSQYQFHVGRNNLGGTHGPMHTHILIRENAPTVFEPERREVLVHELGHFLGAAHSHSQDSAMRPVVGDGRARNTDFRIEFDPINARIVRLVGREMRDRHVRHFQALSPKTLRELLPLYEQLLRNSPQDPSSQRYVQVVRALTAGAPP